MPVLSCASLAEPGVFGIRPVLLLPKAIEERLTQSELAAILAHEQCHARRRDNLGAALHMAVETLFWFYPLVWWIERQLVRERERACDEEVLRSGSDPETYAEGILKACRFYLESSLVCAAGITGADLKRRIEEIMTRRAVVGLGFGKKLLLTSAACAALAVPVVLGIIGAPPIRAQMRPSEHLAFEAASIKDPGRPTLFQIFDRLGLKLQSTRAPVDIYVIDSVQMPSANGERSASEPWRKSYSGDNWQAKPPGPPREGLGGRHSAWPGSSCSTHLPGNPSWPAPGADRRIRRCWCAVCDCAYTNDRFLSARSRTASFSPSARGALCPCFR